MADVVGLIAGIITVAELAGKGLQAAGTFRYAREEWHPLQVCFLEMG